MNEQTPDILNVVLAQVRHVKWENDMRRLIWRGVLGFLGVCSAIAGCMIAVGVVFLLTRLMLQRLGGNANVSDEVIGQVASIIVATAALLFQSRYQVSKEIAADGREIYQRLELASIDLFRFEAEQKELIRPLWEAGVSVPPGDTEQVVFQNYVCQNLNLHEMAIRFRKGKIMPDEVFDSWIAWFWTLSNAPGFSKVWEDVREDYIAELQNTYNKGIEIALRGDGDDDTKHTKHKEFREWLKQELQNGTLGKPAEDNCADSSLLRGSCHVSSASRVEPPPTPDLAWESNPAAALELAQFFAREVMRIPEYISHGEVQIGRAKDFDQWNYGLDSCLESEFREILTHTAAKDCAARIVVARVNNEPVAVAVVRFIFGKSKYAVLEDLVVASTLRRQGVGKMVVLWVEAEAKTQEASFLFLESGAGNTEAHDFFVQLGFRRCSFVMAKSLP